MPLYKILEKPVQCWRKLCRKACPSISTTTLFEQGSLDKLDTLNRSQVFPKKA
jgi:hypothetical protein